MNEIQLLRTLNLVRLSDCYIEILMKIPSSDGCKEIRETLQSIYNRGRNNILECKDDPKAILDIYIQTVYELVAYIASLEVEDDFDLEDLDEDEDVDNDWFAKAFEAAVMGRSESKNKERD